MKRCSTSLIIACMHAESLQSCLTLCDPMGCSPPGSPVHGILQARTLEWVAISFSIVWKVIKPRSKLRKKKKTNPKKTRTTSITPFWASIPMLVPRVGRIPWQPNGTSLLQIKLVLTLGDSHPLFTRWSLIIREMQIETAVRYHLTTECPSSKKSTNNKC